MTKIVIKKTKKVMPALLPPNWVRDTVKALGCARSTVWDAMRNGRKGPVADRIRAYVLEKYGTVAENQEVVNE